MGLTRIRAEQISDIDYKQAVRVITVSDVTLSGGAPATVDGVSLVTGDRVLVSANDPGSENGIYEVQTVGAGSTGTWIRASDGNTTGELQAGLIIMVTEGDTYKDTQWKLTTNNPIIVGTTPLVFEQNSAFAFGNIYANSTAVLATSVGDSVTFTAGDNISILGNNTSKTVTIGVTGISLNSISNGTSNVNVVSSGGNVTVGVGGTSNVAVFAATGEYVTGLLSVTGNITGGNVLTAGLISATGNITGGNITIPGTANISTFIGNVFFGSVPAQPTWYTVAPLNLNNSLSAATKVQLNLINTGGGAGAGSAIDFYTYQISVAAANAESRIAAIDDGNYSAYLSLQTKTPGSTGTNGLVERVKIDSTGASVVGNVTGGNLNTAGQVIATGNIVSSGNITGGNVLFGSGVVSGTGNITGGNILGNGFGLTGINTFSNIAVTGSDSILADSISDTLTFVAGDGISITANAATDTITIASVGSESIFATGGDMDTVIEAVTASEDLGLVTEAPPTESYDLGSIGVDGVVTDQNIALNTITGNKFATDIVISTTGNITAGNIIVTGNIYQNGNLYATQIQSMMYALAF
jgi:hypothetical protein